MGKREKGEVKKYIYMTGLALRDNNRGTAALGYGALGFLCEKGLIKESQSIVNIEERSLLTFAKAIIKRRAIRKKKEIIKTNNQQWQYEEFYIFHFEKRMARRFPLLRKFSIYERIICNTEFVAAINGGDGFSDIYGKEIFIQRLPGIQMAMENGIPLMLLPQTIGPFNDSEIWAIAKKILHYADWVFVRDKKFTHILDQEKISYEVTKDLSYYMKPETWQIDIPKGCVGLNVSGLAYSNNFSGLEHKFDLYPVLIRNIISEFQTIGVPLFLIPHSYNHRKSEPNNDDLEACRKVYSELKGKKNVYVIDKDMTSPMVKYVISRMSFFIGTRMHANFAAIYTNVPVFGLAYSYKFAGGFSSNGLDGEKQTAMIIDMTQDDVTLIVQRIMTLYKESIKPNMS